MLYEVITPENLDAGLHAGLPERRDRRGHRRSRRRRLAAIQAVLHLPQRDVAFSVAGRQLARGNAVVSYNFV